MVKHRRHSSESLTEWGWRADRKFIPTEYFEEDFDLDSNVYDDGNNLTNVPCPRAPVALSIKNVSAILVRS